MYLKKRNVNNILSSFQSVWNVSEVAFWNRQILRPGCGWCRRGKRERGAETKLKRCWLRSTWGLSGEERTRQGKMTHRGGVSTRRSKVCFECFPIYGFS